MKYGFVAYDMGPSKYNKMIADRMLKAQHHEVVFVPAQKKDLALEYGAELATCDLIVFGGPASFDTEVETNLLDALPEEIPLVVLEDVPGSCLRPKFKNYASRAKVVVVAMEQSAQGALQFGYQATEYLGLPQHWKSGYDALVSADKVSARARFNKSRRIALGDTSLESSDKVLSYGCVKHAGINNLILAYMTIAADDATVLAFKTRGDEKLDDREREVRESLVRLQKEAWFLNLGNATLTEVLCASDIAVFSGGATDSISCALARFPAIYCTSNEVRAVNLKQGIPEDGEWFVSKMGGNLVVDMDNGPDEFSRAVRSLLTPQGQAELRHVQEAVFPAPPAVWETDCVVVRYLEHVAANS